MYKGISEVIGIEVEFQAEMAENLSKREDVNELMKKSGPDTEPWVTPCVTVNEILQLVMNSDEG